MEKAATACYEYNIPIFVVFIDFMITYDSIRRIKLIDVIKDSNISPKTDKISENDSDIRKE